MVIIASYYLLCISIWFIVRWWKQRLKPGDKVHIRGTNGVLTVKWIDNDRIKLQELSGPYRYHKRQLEKVKYNKHGKPIFF